MLKRRVIPTLLWKDVGLVKGAGFDSGRRVGSVLPAIKIYNLREVDELMLLDITGTANQGEPDYEAIEEYCLECFVPMTFGGGIRRLDQITEVLKSGADKVAINSAAYADPGLISAAANRFGSQCVVASIDFRRTDGGGAECFSHCGSQATGRDPVAWAREVERLGAGEILLTSVVRDGTMLGYDLETTKAVAEAVTIPVIASGGAGNYGHMAEVIREAGASAVAAASIFHFTQQTPLEAKRHLAGNGVPVRSV